MTLEQAIEIARKKPTNENLHWFVGKWNDGYIIYSSTYMKRNPGVKYVYSTLETKK